MKEVTPELVEAQKQWEQRIAEEEKKIAKEDGDKKSEPSPELKDTPKPILELIKKNPSERSKEEKSQLLDHFISKTPLKKDFRERIAKLVEKRRNLRVPLIPIMRELKKESRRSTHIHKRGSYRNPGKQVEAGILKTFHPLPENAPGNRLGVARWLVSADNPLTARVLVNRIWARLFGIGIVETEEDFGSQGLPPSHPFLLDWLAIDLMENGWSMKHLVRRIVGSSTYLQSSRVTEGLAMRDPRNRLLARGARFRLEAEMVRDSTMSVSGLLSRKLHGPSVMPPQPPGIWQTIYIDKKWETSKGEDRFRRALYTFMKRSSPYPSMTTFDTPNREGCAVRRIRTNTPLQALLLLNDPVFIEAAQALARRATRVAPGTGKAAFRSRIRHAFNLALSRLPTEDETRELLSLNEERLEVYGDAPDAALEMATNPLGAMPDGLEVAELAALTVVCNVILNLDEFLTRS